MKARRKLLVCLMTLALTLTSFGMVGNMSTVKAAEDDGVAMYRMYNPYTGEHLYTKNESEKDWLVGSEGWNFEGYAWVSANEGTPVYRLFNKYSKEHHYTKDESEKAWLLSSGAWNDEGIAWHTKSTGDSCEVPVYRLFCPFTNEALKAHHYTMDKGERDWLLSIGWNDEGTCWTSMHSVVTGTYEEATCTKEGHDGGARCKTCNKVYNARVLPKNPNNHQHTTYAPAVTETIERDVLGWCEIYSCAICGEDIYKTGDRGPESVEDLKIEHLKKHGYNYISYTDVLNGLATEEQYENQDWSAYNSSISYQRVPAYTDTVVISPAHTHCNDCGKDF